MTIDEIDVELRKATELLTRGGQGASKPRIMRHIDMLLDVRNQIKTRRRATPCPPRFSPESV